MAGLSKLLIENVEFTFNADSRLENQVTALKDINLSIEENQIVALLGPSGCGKTTLLRIMAGLLSPTKGKVLLDGNLVTSPGPDRAVVFQEDAVFPWLTVEDNVAYGLTLKGVPETERADLVEQYINRVGLGGFEKRFPRELSGGMRKRVDIARCYVNDPAILLMDEPFGALDAMTRSNMHIDLLHLWKENKKTICFVTHDIEEAIFLSQKVVMLSPRPGRVQSVVDIPFGEERSEELKITPEFQRLRKNMWMQLRDDPAQEVYGRM
jgi:NitT/TauT family transport system ATP-binding protein